MYFLYLNMDVLNQDSQLTITLLIDEWIFYLKPYVFEHNALCYFYHVLRSKWLWCRFFPKSPEKLSHLVWKLFCNKDIIRIICLELIKFSSRLSLGVFFRKVSTFITSLTRCCVFHNLSKSEKLRWSVPDILRLKNSPKLIDSLWRCMFFWSKCVDFNDVYKPCEFC